MVETIKYRLSEQQDLNEIRSLLNTAGLPVADIGESNIDFIVAINSKETLIGCIGLEKLGTDGLLRSLAVDPSYRNKKIGKELVNRLLSVGRQYGINDLHLLTTTAERFFSSIGFSAIPRNEAPSSMQGTAEFSSLCPSSSTCMVLKHIQKLEAGFWKDTQLFLRDKESGSPYWMIRGEGLMFTYFEVSPHTQFALHTHISEQITYILDGELFFEIENKTYCLKGGDSVIIPPNKPHRVWTLDQPTKAVDAWAPLNEKYSHAERADKNYQSIK